MEGVFQEYHPADLPRLAHAMARAVVRELPERTRTGRIRCHEVARAVSRILGSHYGNQVVVDGKVGPLEHSWIVLRDTALILDCYTPGRYPLVQIVDPYFAPHAQLYQPGPDRTDIDTELVTFLVRRACSELGLDAPPG